MTGIAVLGSTGSIGRQALDVISAIPARFSLLALASARGGKPMAEQLSAFPSARWWCADRRQRELAPDRWAADGLTELATLDGVDLVVVATTGMAALPA
ncbi:MAG: 1-deoxy-D-xylulose-5-phosphate reductoisomerase, partial [Chloroflexota bacterium]|nr:1-deoxy-D-xylulose-5-phosphate reductoisomerase [Chloroflexota bacterium]